MKKYRIVLVDKEGYFVAYGNFNLNRGQLTEDAVMALKRFMVEREDMNEALDIYVRSQKIGVIRWNKRFNGTPKSIYDFIEIKYLKPINHVTYIRDGKMVCPDLAGTRQTEKAIY